MDKLTEQLPLPFPPDPSIPYTPEEEEAWQAMQEADEEVRRARIVEILNELYMFYPELARELAGLVGFKTEFEVRLANAFDEAA